MLTYTQIFIGVGSGAVVWHSSHGTSFWPARINLWMHSSMAQILSFAASPRAIKAFGTETVLRRVLDVLVMFVLGFFLDTFEIIFVVVPITAAALIVLGVNPIWLGVMIGMNLQTSFLTPPFGFALFYLRGVASKTVSTIQIYRGAVPFVGLQIVGMVILWFLPGLATWLPDQIYNNGVPRTYLADRDTSGTGDGAGQYERSDEPFELPIDNNSVFELGDEGGGGMFGEPGGGSAFDDPANMFNDAPAGEGGGEGGTAFDDPANMFNDPPAEDGGAGEGGGQQ